MVSARDGSPEPRRRDDWRYTAEVMIILCRRLSVQPCSTQSIANQSRSSGWVGASTLHPEVIRRGHDPESEVVLPDAIDDDTGGQGI